MKAYQTKIRNLLLMILGMIICFVVILINGMYYNSIKQGISLSLLNQMHISESFSETQQQNEIKDPPEDKLKNDTDNYSDQPFFIVCRNSKNVFSVRTSMYSNLSSKEIQSLAKKALSTHSRRGRFSTYYFETDVDDDNLIIGIVDISQLIARERLVLWISIVLSIAIFLLLIIPIKKIAERMSEPLEVAIQKQKTFVSFAGHELKTPLTVMKASFSMMKKEGIESRYLEDAIAENQKMTEMVTELLEYTKLDQMKELQMEEVDLNDLVMNELLSFDAYGYEKQVKLSNELETSCMVWGNKKELSKMLDTLIENAIDHTAPNGEVVVSLKERHLSIKNQGQPIPENERSRIFDLYYHLPSEDDNGNHFGMGLAIAQTIAKKHGTEIKLTCEKGWNQFFVDFPEIK